MQKNAIILGGGKGKRMKSALPKQFLILADKPILMHSIKKFYEYDKNIKIILVLPEEYIELWKNLCTKYKFQIPHIIIKGGKERFFSVKNGLSAATQQGLIAIHDGVRPFISSDLIDNGFNLASKHKTAIPVISPTSSIRIIENNFNYHIDRDKIKLVQTPQFFDAEIIHKAYETKYSKNFTDDASVAEANGEKIFIFDGNQKNIKITTKFDLDFANFLLKNQN
jgi:2-C-methyl-D-erythritol 4-phosphate cytidylyltransferase